ncbi:hypothetical protein HPULCUR_011743 [Helicostylum pulchrum]|uniref:Uncharacterized protein n=1 Tax=Helicostylum pulchrum TaxID=562976 RepID=A0ABP9YI04_9FUNG
MCITTDCILATPYSTGDNEGSTCAVTHQNEGYDFYNYCLSSGTDSDGDNCDTSTQCYQYRQGNVSYAMHAWDNLMCDQDSCSLINADGTQPSIPIPIGNTSHPTAGTGSGNSRKKEHEKEKEKNNTVIIVVTSVCTFISIIMMVLFGRILLSKFLCFGICSKNNETIIQPTAPPSFQSEMVMRSNNSSDLPAYPNREPSPPKYQEAIVTQIRGIDHHPSTSTQSNILYQSNDTPEDWATQTIRH